jgi:conjugal transfer pilus assembly protein TraE
MKDSYFNNRLEKALYQRNILLPITILLSVALLVSIIFLSIKKERIVIVPANITKDFWIDSNTISPTYLDQMGQYFASILLTKSSSTSLESIEKILPHIHPSNVTKIRQALIMEYKQMQKGNISYVFYPEQSFLNMKDLTVSIEGEFVEIVSNKIVSKKKTKFALSFIFSGGKLMLTNLVKIEDREDKSNNFEDV